MFTLNLPKFTPKLIEKNGKHLIWDPVRQKFVAFTPEEWVRQNFVHFLLTCRDYPQALLNNEVLIKLNGTTKRAQIARYNMVLHVKYLIVSNGLQHYCCQMDYECQTYHFLENIPTYNELLL